MRRTRKPGHLKITALVLIAIVPVVLGGVYLIALPGALAKPRSKGPTHSSPIAITSDDRFLWVVNPDNNSVSLLEVGDDVNRKVAEIPVGEEPRCVAVTPDDRKAYVTNTASGTVSVIDTRRREVVRTIQVGSEPIGCALTEDGKTLYVTNFSSDDVSVIKTKNDRVRKTIENVGPRPRAIAITAGHGPDKVYVTHFLAELRNDERTVDQKEGRDDGKEGRVTILSTAGDRILGTAVLHPLPDTGFKSNGSTLDRVPVRVNDAGQPIFDTTTGAFPNLLDSIVIKGNRAYLPNTASSPNGPFRFNVNVQGVLSVLDVDDDEEEVDQTINMNKGVQFEPPGRRLFITNPIAVAFKRDADEGFVVSAATNRLVRVVLDDAGKPTINAPIAAGDPGAIVRIPVGANPQGIVLDSTDSRAYVMNFISRDVSVVDIAGDPSQYHEISRILSANLPAAGSLAAMVQRGHELFNTSIGPAGTNDNSRSPAGRMSDFGWGTCYSCHPSGLTDGVTWMFGDGPRQSISMESTFEHAQATASPSGAIASISVRQRVLNWSAVRDEVQDFELNIRGVSGGQGLIAKADGTVDPCVFNLVLPNPNPLNCPAETAITTGRSADLDTIAAYLAFGVRAPISPSRGEDVERGRSLFETAQCQSCHGGPSWTRGLVDFSPPPVSETITGGQLVRFLRNVGTFDPSASNELRANQTANTTANGALGFNIASLLSVFAGAPYLHSGAARTLDEVLENITHRSAGTSGLDTLANPDDRRELVRFLKSIDAATPPFP